MSTVAIYPGTFDPMTLGHVDLAQRAARLFDRLIVAVAAGAGKGPLFSLAERVAMARGLTRELPNVEVDSFDGLLVDYAHGRGVRVVVRGVRAFSDFEYELQMALSNRKMAADVETLFLMPTEAYSYLSSSIVREVASLGGDTREFVPPLVQEALRNKFQA